MTWLELMAWAEDQANNENQEEEPAVAAMIAAAEKAEAEIAEASLNELRNRYCDRNIYRLFAIYNIYLVVAKWKDIYVI